jgi:hypothetical protein
MLPSVSDNLGLECLKIKSHFLQKVETITICDSKLLDFEILNCSNVFFQIPGLPEGFEFIPK